MCNWLFMFDLLIVLGWFIGGRKRDICYNLIKLCTFNDRDNRTGGLERVTEM